MSNVLRRQLQILRQLGALKRRRRLPKLKHPDRIAEDYAKRLSEVEAMMRSAYHEAFERLPGLIDNEARQRQDAPGDDPIVGILKRASATLTEHIEKANFGQAAGIAASQTAGFHRAQFQRVMEAGVGTADVFTSDPRIPTITRGFVAENVGLIRGLAQEQSAKLEKLITRAVANGERWEGIAGAVEEVVKTTGKRARFIARDQVGKFYGQVNAARQKEIGIARFTWRTVNDARVRPEHRALEGRVFSYANPPSVGLPGEPILCRCYAEPLLDDLLGDDAPQAAPEPVPESEPEYQEFTDLGDARGHITVANSRLAINTVERDALLDYSGIEGYSRINEALRTTNRTPRGVKALDSAIAKARIKQPLKVFRGFRRVPEGFSIEPGVEVSDKAFVSTSLRREVAEGFSGALLFEIDLPAGSSAFPVAASLYPDETELLLPRGTRFLVTEVLDGYPKIARVKALPPKR